MTRKAEKATISVRPPEQVRGQIDELVKEGLYKNRADFVYDAIRDSLRRIKVLNNHAETST